MKIYLSSYTAGRSGGGLNGNLRYLDRYIQMELDKLAFKSSFDELWLTLSYPPMYVSSGIVGTEITFKKYYDSFPYSRLNRRYKKIDIYLKAPEFSEYFNKEAIKHEHKFDIESQFENISETELGKILVDKFLEAVEIVNTKLKKGDTFDCQSFRDILLEIKQKINSQFLKEINIVHQEEVKNDTLARAVKLRESRYLTNEPKNKLIRDIRVYYTGLPKKALYPYDYIYTEIFLNLLAREGLMCPKYDHLYIQVAKTMDEALKNSFSIEEWYVNGLSILDFDRFQLLSEKQKEKEVFQIILAGLKDIATIDKLDIDKINKVAYEITKNGIDTELLFKTIENSKYRLRITYFSRSIEDECPIFFNLTDKISNITKRHQIGKAEIGQLHLWLQKVKINNKQIKVKSSDSIRGQVWIKEKSKSLEFEIIELMK